MSKLIAYTGANWPGSVTFHDPLTLEQEAAFEFSNSAVKKTMDDGGGQSAVTLALLPGVFACVEKWSLQDFPTEPNITNFPTRPKEALGKLIAWLIEQISTIYVDNQSPPNASWLKPTPIAPEQFQPPQTS